MLAQRGKLKNEKKTRIPVRRAGRECMHCQFPKCQLLKVNPIKIWSMLLILDGNSVIDAHASSNLCHFIESSYKSKVFSSTEKTYFPSLFKILFQSYSIEVLTIRKRNRLPPRMIESESE